METQIDTTELVELGYYLKKVGKPHVVRGAMSSAMNRALTATKKEAKRLVQEEYAVKPQYVNQSLIMKRASKISPQAELESKGSKIPLSHFPHTPTRVTKSRKPVKVQVKRSGGKRELASDPGAFIGKTKSGKKHIFARKSRSRLPITALTALAVPTMIEEKDILSGIREHALGKYNERIHHELNYRLKKIQKKSKGKG